jgi:predicted patatin/cPLA2 family phospholipase
VKYKPYQLIIFWGVMISLSGSYAQEDLSEMINAALVLEGGALRSVYTAGVLDVFMENDMEFATIVGVSAGALTAGNYIAKHIGRSARINILHSNDKNYFGIRQLLFRGSIFNFNYIFYTPIKDLYPYDEDALINSNVRFLIGATNCNTGRAEYFERNNYADLVHVLQASSSIQLVSKPVNIDGKLYLDGAIADPIGVYKAFSEGHDKAVLVLTRPYGYRSKRPSMFIRWLNRIVYRKYPELVTVLNYGYQAYNALLDEIDQMEKENRVVVIRPSRHIEVKHLERDARVLTDLYLLGRDDARRSLPRIFEYIGRV